MEDGLDDCGNDVKPTPSCCSSLVVLTHNQHEVPDGATVPPQTRPAQSCQLQPARTIVCFFLSPGQVLVSQDKPVFFFNTVTLRTYCLHKICQESLSEGRLVG